MYKQKIIESIQSQIMLEITFRREKDDSWVTRKVAPYDVFPREDRQSHMIEDILLGYADQDYQHESHTVSIYLNNIQSVKKLLQTFNGQEIRRLLKVRRPPYISRNW